MSYRGSSLRRATTLLASLALVAVGGIQAATSAPKPTPITTPGGLRPGQAVPATTCDGGVCIVKATTGRSCTGYISQSVPPANIKVLVHTPTAHVESIPFRTYVANVLPNEWVPSWDGDALKAGAVAVKSYAWYWVTHYGGYLNTTANCFDVTDDQNFQVYRAASNTPRTDVAVQKTWNVAARMSGRVIQASYRAYLDSQYEACGTFAKGAILSQWGTQNCVEANTGNKYNVILQKYYFPGLQLATAAQRRTPHDFTFLQTSTRAVFSATTATWSIDDGYPTVFRFGLRGDLPAVTDAGDGFATIGVFRPSTGSWYQAGPTGRLAVTTKWGNSGDIPVPGHYSGVSRPSVLATFRPSNSTWYLRGIGNVPYGSRGDIPVPGHYAGTSANDYTDHPALFRPSTAVWYRQGLSAVQYGARGDIPVPGDYTGNGTTDIAVYRPSTHTWYIRGVTSVRYGIAGDIPVTGDYNGDGKTDIAVYRPSTHTWYMRGQAARSFGTATTTPIGKAPYRG
ncbi:MAG: hypothetical protein DLM58_07425 [Pseudonocardiales bacterium]|nr:MAG: hypothetical protein DLM58_07425 [Pseudonocardiales bacterium]